MSDGNLEMYGAAIKLAINEYQTMKSSEKEREKELAEYRRNWETLSKLDKSRYERKSRLQRNFETARSYLFNSDWLETQLETLGLNEILNIDYIRIEAERGVI